MKLLTKEIIERLPKLGTHSTKPASEVKIV